MHEHCGDNLAIAFDPSYISKYGKKIPGVGYFWSGCAGKATWSLEIFGVAAIDCANHTAFHLEVVQTVILLENETLLDWYKRMILERKLPRQELSKIILVDAYFSKYNFVQPLVEESFVLISRLRDDADLKYIFLGEQRIGRGRPRKHKEKIDFKNLDLSKLIKVSSQAKETIFSGIVFSKSLKMNINLVIVKKKNKD